MEKLFKALENKHPGYKLVDIKFSIESLSKLDEKLAEAVKNAVKIPFEMFGEYLMSDKA